MSDYDSTIIRHGQPLPAHPHPPDTSSLLYGSARERARQLVERCGGGREYQGRWKVCCPAHSDRSPSLQIAYDADHVMLHCFAGCETHDILHELGLRWADLFADDRTHPAPPKRPKHLGPRIPEPPGAPTPDHMALQLALELLIDDCSLLQVEACQDLLRRMAQSPLLKLWIEQQLQQHRLDPALVWRVVQLPLPSATGGLRMVALQPSSQTTDGGPA